MAHYIAYYENQVDYHGSPYQRGYEIGSFLGGLFRKALPILTKGFNAVGKEVFRSGVQVFDGVTNPNLSPV